MKTYIIITKDGYTEDDECNDTGHCQMLGKYKADSPKEAASICRSELEENGQFYEELIVYELTSPKAVGYFVGTIAKIDLDEKI